MKKLTYSLLAGVALVLTSCSSDDMPNPGGNDGYVTFRAELPAGIDTRAFGDGNTAVKLQYVVYTQDKSDVLVEGTETLTNRTVDIQIPLVVGETYQVIFYADAFGTEDANRPYTFNHADGTLSVDYTKTTANDDKYDAFYKYVENVYVAKDMGVQTVEMTRPFAQINIGTTAEDLAKANNLKIFPGSAAVKIIPAYSELNLFTSVASELKDVEMTLFDKKAFAADETIIAGSKTYKNLAMVYVLADKDPRVFDKVNMILSPEEGKANLSEPEKSYNNIPYKRNHRTNIVGNLLTSNTDWSVVVDEEFDGENNVLTWDGTSFQAITPVTAEVGGVQSLVYTVSTAAQLAWLTTDEFDAEIAASADPVVIELVNDIDLDNQAWPGIGDSSRSTLAGAFSGTFDGNGKVIRGLKDSGNDTDKYGSGFIHVTNGATIKNLEIEGANVSHSKDFAGVIVGAMFGNTTIENCHVSNAKVTSADVSGGIAARAYGDNNIIKDCTVSATSVSGLKTGGIVGIATKNTQITNCENDATVNSGNAGGGGIIGYVSSGYIEITNCSNYGNVGTNSAYENKYSAGIAAYYQGSNLTITNCTNYGTIRGTNASGILGNSGSYQFATVKECLNQGEIIGVGLAGGIVSSGHYYLENDHNVAKVTATGTFSFAGGVAGCSGSLTEAEKCGMIECSGGTQPITATYAGRLCGYVSLQNIASYLNMKIVDENGDDYSSLPTVGAMAAYTAQSTVKVLKGTFHGNPQHPGTASAKVIVVDEGAWDKFPGEQGTWSRLSGADWVKQ